MAPRKDATYKDNRRTLADVNLGEVVRDLRVDRGLTQTELADTLTRTTGQKWTQYTVSSFETARRLMTVSQAAALADALGVTLRTLLRVVTEDVAGSPGVPVWSRPLPDMPEAGYPVERVAR